MISNVIKESSRGYDVLRIQDVLYEQREIFLTEEVSAETCTELMQELMYLERECPGKEITLYISTPGGDVNSGLAVYDCIRALSCSVTTVCIGQAASMGAILFLAGDRRIMYPHTQVMIHDPSYSGGDMSGQKPGDLTEKLEDLKKTQKVIAEIIAERSGLTLKQVYAKTRKDTWLTAEEAVKLGIATEIINTEKGERADDE